jgi:TIR domain
VTPGTPGRVFVSYRRQDARGSAGRIYDQLADRFGDAQVFMDVDTIAPGVDFTKVITEAVSTCEVLLAVIGSRWLTATDEGGRRRLDDPGDLVRLEIAAALDRDIRVIPILVEDATMPRRHELPETWRSWRVATPTGCGMRAFALTPTGSWRRSSRSCIPQKVTSEFLPVLSKRCWKRSTPRTLLRSRTRPSCCSTTIMFLVWHSVPMGGC